MNDASSYNSVNHVDGLIEVSNSYSAAGTPGNGYGACSTASCHDNGRGSIVTTPAWGSSPASCIACHAAAPATGSHSIHLAESGVGCADCHKGAVQSTTVPDQHLDENIDVYVLTSGDLGYPQNKTKATAYSTCSTASCHSNGLGVYKITPPWGGSGTGCNMCHNALPTTGAASWMDVGLAFNQANKSFHPIVAAANSTGSGTSVLAAGQLAGGWTPGQTMYCTDCHSTDSANSTGPHGSAIKWMLAGTNKAWPYTTAAYNGTSSGETLRTYSNRATNQGTSNGLFCLNCHPVTVNNVHTKGDHSSVPCVGCHIRIPHGGKVSRLISAADSATPLTILPSRLAPDGNGGGTVYLRKFTRAAYNSYSKSNCYSSNSSCGSHNSSSYGSESW
ncbi:MAG: CxxxxCH/CxxCH domain-containing protein [Nitrospirae bacterium]|nr:CxxxxCH/CxxCH domain-containing protein [Nitrospirota bacterium]